MTIVLLAEGFEEIEAITVIDFLRRCGIDCKTVSITDSVTVTGAHGIPVTCDLCYTGLSADAPDCVILPGGMPGTKNLGKSEWVCRLLTQTKGLIAAICAAPSVLGQLELLEGKKAICYPGFEPELKGAAVTQQPVVRDGRIITSKAAGTAIDFAEEIARALGKEEAARQVRADMYYPLP